MSEPLEEYLNTQAPFIIIRTGAFLPEYFRNEVLSFFLDLKYAARGEYGIPIRDRIIMTSVIKPSPHFEYIDATTVFYFVTISGDGMTHIDSMLPESSALKLWSTLLAAQIFDPGNIAKIELSSEHDKIYSLLNQNIDKTVSLTEECIKTNQNIAAPIQYTSWDDIGGQFEIKKKLLECLDFSNEVMFPVTLS